MDQEVNPEPVGGFETAAPLDLPDDTDPVDTADSTPTDTNPSDTDTDSTWFDTDDPVDTDTTEPDPFADCHALRPAPWEAEDHIAVKYWEDFAFDNDGSMLTLYGNSLIRQWLDGSTELIFPMFGDSRGHLPIEDDKYVISGLSSGLYIIDEGGGKERIAEGMYILAITVDDDRWAYYDDYSRGTIGRVNLDSYEVETVADGLTYPDGIVWDSYGGQLWVVQNYPPVLTRIPYDASSGTFDDPEDMAVFDTGYAYLDGVTVDHCGNVYIADAASGLYRYVAETETLEVLAEWPYGVYTPSVHFGEGYGDFESDHLFVMDYNGSQLFEFDAQVAGRPNPYVDD